MDKNPPNILMLCLDAVRADHVPGLDGGPSVTPFLGKLASRGVLFTECFAAAPWTLPSFGTLFTGLYPSEHGADKYQALFSPRVPTLAEELGDTYETICVSFNPYLTYRFNLTRGFEKTYVFGRYVPRFYSHRTRYTGWRRFLELARLLFATDRPLENVSEIAAHLTAAGGV